jgi:hypothetical protein
MKQSAYCQPYTQTLDSMVAWIQEEARKGKTYTYLELLDHMMFWQFTQSQTKRLVHIIRLWAAAGYTPARLIPPAKLP